MLMHTMSHRLTFPLLAIFVSLCVFQSSAGAADRNVLFIITDDESPTLGCYGDPIAKTPAIDAIARDGVIFRNAFATTASCRGLCMYMCCASIRPYALMLWRYRRLLRQRIRLLHLAYVSWNLLCLFFLWYKIFRGHKNTTWGVHSQRSQVILTEG